MGVKLIYAFPYFRSWQNGGQGGKKLAQFRILLLIFNCTESNCSIHTKWNGGNYQKSLCIAVCLSIPKKFFVGNTFFCNFYSPNFARRILPRQCTLAEHMFFERSGTGALNSHWQKVVWVEIG